MIKKYKKEIIIVIVSVLLIAIYNLINNNSLYLESPDGNLYLSIADNFINSGHFIQNARIYELGFVVPPGLPIIYTILKIIFGSLNGILIVQYVIFGLTILLIYKITDFLTFNKQLSYLSIIIYFFLSMILQYGNPAYCLTEVWYIFILLLWVLIYFTCDNNKNLYLLITSICLTLIRPAFSIFLLVSFVFVINDIIKKRKIEKKYIITIISTVIFLMFNILINYRETKTFVVIENYSGVALYEANNPNTKNKWYSASDAKEFTEERFWEIENDFSITRGEKSKIYNSWSKKYIINNLKSVIYNTYIKFKKMFVNLYGFDFFILIISSVLAFILKNKKLYFIAFIFFIESVITSMGLMIGRYSIFIIPIYIVFKILLIDNLINLFKKVEVIKWLFQ